MLAGAQEQIRALTEERDREMRARLKAEQVAVEQASEILSLRHHFRTACEQLRALEASADV